MTVIGKREAWLGGGEKSCSDWAELEKPGRAVRLVLLGAPGVGKGTQAELLAGHYKTCHLSTGDVFRACKDAASEPSPVMKEALGYMQRGELVPDSTVVDMVRERMNCLACEKGFLLDGFPRTVAQAEQLGQMMGERGLKLDAVISYELPMDEVVGRLSGRRTCRQCKSTFHLATKPPKQAGVCDHCGGELYQREDDRAESIRVRLEAYEANTAPLIDYYRKQDLLLTVSAEGAPEAIFERTREALDGNLQGAE